jgi:CRP-like cAMP-binding protein
MDADDLDRLPLFAGLAPEQLTQLVGHVQLVTCPAGAEIFAAGDRASQLYFVRSGEVVIRYHPYDGGSLDLAVIQPGSAFGWSAALRRAYYTSAAICRTDAQLLTISAHALHKLMSDDPELASVLLERAALMAGSRLDCLGQQVIGLVHPKTHKPLVRRVDPASKV